MYIQYRYGERLHALGELTITGNSGISPGIAVNTSMPTNTTDTFIPADATAAEKIDGFCGNGSASCRTRLLEKIDRPYTGIRTRSCNPNSRFARWWIVRSPAGSYSRK